MSNSNNQYEATHPLDALLILLYKLDLKASADFVGVIAFTNRMRIIL